VYSHQRARPGVFARPYTRSPRSPDGFARSPQRTEIRGSRCLINRNVTAPPPKRHNSTWRRRFLRCPTAGPGCVPTVIRSATRNATIIWRPPPPVRAPCEASRQREGRPRAERTAAWRRVMGALWIGYGPRMPRYPA
jgi:hypothetical protein